jgi:hypothetical protein
MEEMAFEAKRKSAENAMFIAKEQVKNSNFLLLLIFL